MMAATVGHRDAVALLCQSGADIHMQDRLGLTALNLAARGAHEEIVAFLGLQLAEARKGWNQVRPAVGTPEGIEHIP